MEETNKLEGHEGTVWHVAWHPSGNMIASCGADKTIRLWTRPDEASTAFVCRGVLEDVHQRTIRRVAWSPDGQTLAAASFDATVSVWRHEGGEFECVATLEGHDNEVKGVAFDCTGRFLATCSRDKSVWIWAIEEDEEEYECESIMHGHSQDVKTVAWHPTEQLLASASYDDSVKLWRGVPDAMGGDDDWACVQTLRAHNSTCWDAQFSCDGSRLAVCSDDRSATVYVRVGAGDNARWELQSRLSGVHERAIYSVAWSCDGLLATAAGDDAVAVYEAETSSDGGVSYACRVRVQLKCGDLNCVRFNPQRGAELAVAGDDGSVRTLVLASS